VSPFCTGGAVIIIEVSEATAVFVLDLSVDDLGYKYTIHLRESESFIGGELREI